MIVESESGRKIDVIDSIDDLKIVLSGIEGRMFFDPRYSDRTCSVGSLVGIGFSNGESFHYIPMHDDKEDKLDMFSATAERTGAICFDSKPFIRTMLSHHGRIVKTKIVGLSLVQWISDSNQKDISVRTMIENVLHMKPRKSDMTVLESERQDMFPVDVLAKSTALVCLVLVKAWESLKSKTREYYPSTLIDQNSVLPIVGMEQSPTFMDTTLLARLGNRLKSKIDSINDELEMFAGRKVNINSRPDMIRLFSQLAVPVPRNRENGEENTSTDILESLVGNENCHPVVKTLVDYRENSKLYSSYIKPLLSMNKNEARFMYKMTSAPTGRLSSGSDNNAEVFAPVNIQSIPKPHEEKWFFEEGMNGSDSFLGYSFSETRTSDAQRPIEGMSSSDNLRNVFVPGDGRLWVSVDMKAEELRIASNLMKEDTWIIAFKDGKDVHAETAMKIFGKDSVTSDDRKKAKTCFSENEWFKTESGFVRGKFLKGPENVIDLEGKRQENVIVKGTVKETIHIDSDNGLCFDVTPDHEIEVLRGKNVVWTHARDIRKDDILLFRKNRTFPDKRFVYHGVEIDERMAYNLGVVSGKIGAGGVGYTNVKLQDCEFELIKDDGFFKQVEIDGKSLIIPSTKTVGKIVRTHKDADKIPSYILKSPRSVAEAFVAGLVDSAKVKFYKERRELLYSFHGNERLSKDEAFVFFVLGYKVHGYNTIYHIGSSKTEVRREDMVLCDAEVTGVDSTNRKFTTSRTSFFISDFSGNEYSRTDKFKNVKVWSDEQAVMRMYDKITFEIQPKMDFDYLDKYGIIESGIGTIHLGDASIKKIYSHIDFDVYSPSIVTNIRKSKEKIVILQTSTHMYSAMGLASHNCSFGILYGMGPIRLMKQTGMSYEDAVDFLDRFKRNLPKIYAEQKKWVSEARRTGEIQSFFNRPRKVAGMIDSENSDIRSFAERVVINSPIQGTAADIMKIMLNRVWVSVIMNPKFIGKVSMLSSIHDEINFSVDETMVEEIVGKISEMMTYRHEAWPVTLECGISIGKRWGSLFPFEFRNGKLVPAS